MNNKQIEVEVKKRYSDKDISVALVSWNKREFTIDIRRFRDGVPLKGISLKVDDVNEIIEDLKRAVKDIGGKPKEKMKIAFKDDKTRRYFEDKRHHVQSDGIDLMSHLTGVPDLKRKRER
jgi:hypothetical protein